MNDNTAPPSVMGLLGILASLTLEQVNTGIAILVGLCTLVYMIIKIAKELRNRTK
jgi:hypothetical protein